MPTVFPSVLGKPHFSRSWPPGEGDRNPSNKLSACWWGNIRVSVKKGPSEGTVSEQRPQWLMTVRKRATWAVNKSSVSTLQEEQPRKNTGCCRAITAERGQGTVPWGPVGSAGACQAYLIYKARLWSVWKMRRRV